MLLFALAVTALYLSRPLYDPDFYWHLKTGQWIWQNKMLPHTDPFGIPPLPDATPRSVFILTSYWLIQLIMHAFYSLSGMSGIIAFRWIVAGICLLICLVWTNVRNSFVTAVIALGTILLLEYYFIERPQFISFISFGALVVVLFRFVDKPSERSLWTTSIPLVFIMMFWANVHGGYLIGQALIVYFMIAEGIKFFHPSLEPLTIYKYKMLIISLVAALLASFVNPNAVNLIKYLPIIFDADNYVNKGVLEQLSIIEYFRATGDYTIFLYLASMILTAGAFLTSKHRKNITWGGILVATAFMGYQHMRLLPFFIVSAMLFMTKFYEFEGACIKRRIILLMMLAFTTVYCVKDEFSPVFQVTKAGWVPANQFPVKSVDYISANKIHGNIYTTLMWGGYMLWRTGPESKIFHDGRYINIQRAWEYNNSLNITQNQRPYWKGLMNVHNIRLIVLPLYGHNGVPEVLAQSVAADNGWKLIFASENEAVFMKN